MDKKMQQWLQKHPKLTHSENAKVISHVQREDGDWLLQTIMIEGCDVPFKYKRKKRYRCLAGARINLTYYPDQEQVAGIEFEVMRVVRLRVS